jgi:hypothetical protein
MTPATCVPCHELSATPHSSKRPALSPALTQSPGSVASASRPLPSLAMAASYILS